MKKTKIGYAPDANGNGNGNGKSKRFRCTLTFDFNSETDLETIAKLMTLARRGNSRVTMLDDNTFFLK